MLGILEFPVIPQPLWGIFIGNSRALVIASEAKQSLGILDFALGILEFPKIRHCEGAKRPKQSHLLSLERDCFVVRFTHSSQ